MKDHEYKKDPIKSHHVILYVDTENIVPGNEDNCCWLGWPKNDHQKNKDWYTYVDPGEYITWIGLSISSPNDIVNITSISHEKKSNVFGKTILHGNGESPEKVIGTVQNDTDDENEQYMISFTVSNGNNGGLRNGSYRVDPEIRVRPPGSGG
ncbi:hypothetical protein [Lutimonas sp.]|uniref:hypothetical protein n=1 Tax=Lutimonas sp. TaxID=1872403 RepID=UPI003D9BF014